ncbi:hypothetical protein Ddye_026170 [Dipteronia dyeriana]|uniref:Disease resistance RPP13-like protein 1 n=1 Tax=Dipteronia dyeriana TaxID=168575 RepID=A0AAD9TLP4_9ROSI|nr:hypothetical protein Ddye_025723 [Dipteronia dyeriana]KAK2638375.1 hypothetical protein Ddye_026170 [Dipteronia dyeriana]
MEVIGEAFVPALLGLLVDELRSSDLLKFARQEKVSNELKRWEKNLKKIQAVLEDADEKQITSRVLKLWLEDLRDLAFDLEDLLDEFSTQYLQQKLMNKSKVRILIPYCFSGVMFNVSMTPKIKEMSVRLRDILTQKDDFHLREIVSQVRKNCTYQRLPSTSLVESKNVFGRENDKEAIIELLFKNQNPDGGGEIGVIPICGMAGIGKTTLAQLVYNDERVTYGPYGFDFKFWVHVSEDFDLVKITKIILQATSYETYDVSDLNKLQVMLREKLAGKKFLLVLDDVWNENYTSWCVLGRPFTAADHRSKIIVTTRNHGVGSIMGTVATYHLKLLSDEDCIFLFARHALGTRNFDEYPYLKLIAEEIVKKCKGLPLAAKAMGGLLRTKLDRREWETILNSKMWNFPEERVNIIPALRLSYYYLPSHLKRLFAYCSIFPKDYEFNKDELILLWMAEGFLPNQQVKKQVEDAGRSYFNELLSRSFFERSTSKHFVMHDLIHDLAQYVSREICFNASSKFETDGPDGTLRKTRHLAFTRCVYDVSQRFEVCYKMKYLRTLIALPIHHQSPWTACCYLSEIVLSKMLQTFRCLRSLCLSGYYIRELPNSIGDLKHLRYLNLSYTKIKSLPGSVSNLVNLETLQLRGCSELTKLPSGIRNLIHLYYLDIRDTNCLLDMPSGIGNLTSLRVLTKYIVGKGDQLSLRGLKDLSHLQGELSIHGLGNVCDTVDAKIANLKKKQGLDDLTLEWSENMNNSQNEQIDMSVLEFLQPHRSLKKLRISHYGGTNFASWIGDPSFTDMVCLDLCHCRNIVSLPSLGLLPKLRELCVEGLDGIERVDVEFYGERSAKSFPSLEILQFKNMKEWVLWSDDRVNESFPCLHQLTLHNCPELKGELPSQISSIVKFTVSHCPKLMSPFSLSSLLELNIAICNEVMLSGLSTLTTLKIRKCCSQWMSSMSLAIPNLVSLKYLQIESCPNLVSFPETGFGSMLRHLILKDCPAMKALPKDIMIDCCESNSCLLEELEIEGCCSLEFFPKGKLSTTLKRLTIQYCENLRSLPEGVMQDDNNNYKSQLEILKIVGCPSLQCSTSGKLPYGLKILKISECSSLEPLTETMIEDGELLEYIEISHCETLKTLPEFRNSLPLLTEITIIGCPLLKCLPETGLPMSLQVLTICDCPSLLSLGCLPPDLTSLEIWNCMNLNPISEWKLHGLTSLKDFSISGECFRDIISFPDDEYLLPGNLVSLCISKLENLETLTRGLNNLTLLQELEIIRCHKLRSFPSEGLPSSLGRLRISDCPLLRKERVKWKGHIPCVELDDECI